MFFQNSLKYFISLFLMSCAIFPLNDAAANSKTASPFGKIFFQEQFNSWSVACRSLSKPRVSCVLHGLAKQKDTHTPQAIAVTVDAPLEGLQRVSFAGTDPIGACLLQIDEDFKQDCPIEKNSILVLRAEKAKILLSAMAQGEIFTIKTKEKSFFLPLAGFVTALEAYRAQSLLFHQLATDPTLGKPNN